MVIMGQEKWVATIVLCFRILFTDYTIQHVLDQARIIVLIGAYAVWQFVMESPAFIIAAFQAPDLVPFLPASRSSMHAAPAVPVFKRASTAWADAFFFTVY